MLRLQRLTSQISLGRLAQKSAQRRFSPALTLSALSTVIMLSIFAPAFAATELTDRALRQQTEANHSDSNVAEVLDCDKDMSREACNRLQYERYAKQTDRSYDEFLRNETTNPLRNQVIKQPLLTQPLENPTAPPASRLADLSNQAPLLPNNLP